VPTFKRSGYTPGKIERSTPKIANAIVAIPASKVAVLIVNFLIYKNCVFKYECQECCAGKKAFEIISI